MRRVRTAEARREAVTTSSRTRAAAAALLALAASLSGCAGAPRTQGAMPVVELRLAEFEPRGGFVERTSRDGERLWIAPEAILSLEDFSTAFVRRQGDEDFLLLNVKPGSRIRLDAATLAHLERPVAFMVDGAIAYVPVLRTSISRQVPVRIGVRGVTRDEARRIIDALDDLREFGASGLRRQEPAHPAPGV